MNRTDLQLFSAMRLSEAKALLKARQYSGAYYIAGYCIECAIKAVIAKNRGVRRYEFPENIKISDYYTHSFATLVKTARISDDLKAEMDANITFAANWREASAWRETSRYEKHTKQEAQSLITAIEEPTNGVMQWLKHFW